MVHLVELFLGRLLVTGKFRLLAEDNARDREFALRILLHVADRFIDIFIQHEFLLTSDREEGEHVTAGERSDKRFLRVDMLRVAEIGRRGRGLHFVATIKSPGVIARIFLIVERRIAALPGESDFVFGHSIRIKPWPRFSTADYADQIGKADNVVGQATRLPTPPESVKICVNLWLKFLRD